jgi:mycobactin peptide synthetase MbtE
MAETKPEATALVHGPGRTTYRQLDRLADVYAAELSALGLRAGGFVPVRLPRSVRLVAVALAALKLGAAYALIDPAWPDERVRDEIEQLQAAVFVSDTGTGTEASASVLVSDNEASASGEARTAVWSPPFLEPAEVEHLLAARGRPVLPEVRPQDACCVFFTSGTTGRPKGVISPHSGTVRMVDDGTFADFGPDTVMAQAAALPWDACNLELWTPLLVGGTTILVDEPYLSGALLRGLIAEHGKNTAWLTASLFNMLVDEDPGCFAGLRTVMIGGERLSPPHVRAFLTAHPEVALINGYGPVESTIFVSTRRIRIEDCDIEGGIPIGTPCPRTRAFVLSGEQECPDGEVGELCAAGAGLAIGYLGDPQLTEAKFPTVRLGGRSERVYRTGDLVLRDSAGVLHYRGRADRQLKIRGHRIEPGDVEAVLAEYPGVARGIVHPRRAADGSAVGLSACYTTRDGHPVSHQALDGHLRARLAAYQVPDLYLHLPAVPLTANGKLDTKALEERVREAAGPGAGVSEARRTADGSPDDGPGRETGGDPMLRAVLEVFAGVLPAGAVVSPDATLAELGGTSLDAGRACARLNDSLRRPVPVSQIYRTPTARGLAAWLRETAPSGAPESAGPSTANDPAPLSGLQGQMLIDHVLDPDDRSMHCVVAWRVEGRPDRAALRSAFAYLHGRHGMLRGVFSLSAESVVQPSELDAPPLVELIADTAEDAVAALDRELARPFRLETGDVWRPVYIAVRREPVTLLGIAAHHAVFDGASAPVVADELAAAYNAYRKGAAPELPDAPTPAQIARIRESHLRYADLEAQRAHWSRTLAQLPEFEFPRDDPPAAGPAARIEASVPAELAERVGKLASAAAVSPYAVYLAAYTQSMARLTGRTGFAVSTPFNQRADSVLGRAVSCLIGIVCIPAAVGPDTAADAAIAATAAACADAFAAQDAAFDELMRHLLRQAPGFQSPLFQNLFVLQDNPAAVLPLDGLRATPFLPGYPDSPGDLCTELWPLADGGLGLVASYRPARVSSRFVRELTEGFLLLLTRYTE